MPIEERSGNQRQGGKSELGIAKNSLPAPLSHLQISQPLKLSSIKVCWIALFVVIDLLCTFVDKYRVAARTR